MNVQNSGLFPPLLSSIAEILYDSAERYPNRPALISQDYSLTYSQLGRKVSSEISRLKDYTAGDKNRIAIIGNNHPGYIIGYFAAQFLGASTVEVGRNEALETLLGIVRQTKASYVITDRDDLIDALQGEIPTETFEDLFVTCESDSAELLPLLQTFLSRNNDKLREASIVYTSGTTGFPKGVVLSQGNFLFVASSVVDYLKLTHEDRYALVLPLSHTYGKSVMLTSFAVGAAIVLVEKFQNLPQFLSQLEENRCTMLSIVPYHANMLLKWGNLSGYDLSSLRAITSSGNKLPPATIDGLLESLPAVRIFSMFGLTETTTRACYVPPKSLFMKKESCGRPLPGVECKIVEEDGSELPVARIGEVLLRGPNIMQGYFGDPELTEKTLVDDWLWTGDLGYLDEDGFLYLEGRKKDIIKCAGERISPTEIEEILMKHPGVEEVAVKGSPDQILGEIVHAFIVPRSDSLELSELRTYCAKRLSHHKIPRSYSFVKNIPKTATGKVQKHLLDGM